MKTALIIGASSGIGKELAKLLVADNYKVIITGGREKLLKEIQETAPEKYIIKVQDVTDLISCDKLFENLKNEFKTIDLIVYSSGVGEANYTLDWQKELPTLNTNILSPPCLYVCYYAYSSRLDI